MPPAGDLAYNPGICPYWELDQQSFSLQNDAQPTEPHQWGLIFYFNQFQNFLKAAVLIYWHISAFCTIGMHTSVDWIWFFSVLHKYLGHLLLSLWVLLKSFVTPVRMAIISESTNDKGWWGCGGKGALVHCWWECSHMENSMEVPQMRFHFWVFPEETWNTNLKEYMHPYVYCYVISIAKIYKQYKCPSTDK